MDYGHPVRFGVNITPDATRPAHQLELAALADELGFDLIGVQDHPYQRRFVDTWTLLTAMAMRTSNIHVFPDVTNLPLRPPAILAKAAATLDLLSNGRVELGLGAGALWEAIKAIGGPERTPGESVEALEEAIQVIRLMWSGERAVRFDGKHYSWPACTRARRRRIRSESGWARTSPGCCLWSVVRRTVGFRRSDTSSRETCSRETGASTKLQPRRLAIRD
jgi:alkanesulfonate monooxygenase SsuD/methylene tetrahydromethanopterin reductase-like flavin-dependent oxidoreductase (luciferase family)